MIGIDPGQDGRFSCSWLGCKQHFPSLNKVKTHCRRHTGEKVVACFNCGGMFATNAVFEDHCVRQVGQFPDRLLSLKDEIFQVVPLKKLQAQATEDTRCETCGKSFPSERILRSHARRHINSFKCSYCDMTLSAPSALSKHIRYKHINYRPFHCQYCSFTFVSFFFNHFQFNVFKIHVSNMNLLGRWINWTCILIYSVTRVCWLKKRVWSFRGFMRAIIAKSALAVAKISETT